MSKQSQFTSKVDELIAQSKNLSLKARKNMIELLNEARKKIVAELASVNPQSYTAAQLSVLKQSIDRAMDEFRVAATSSVDGYEAAMFQTGAATVSAPLQALGLESSTLGQVSTSTLSIVQGYTADLISGLSKDAASKVNSTIQRAFLGNQSITDIITQIGKAINKGNDFDGVFSSVGRRATGIALNEIMRVHSIAAQARLEDASERHPDLQKAWDHLAIAKVPRPGHVAADGQVVDVDEPFEVEGEELMYPRDPNGSADNTINCHCLMRPYFAADTLKPSADQKGLLDDLGISVSAA
ncbi:MAG TPA: hypothetical protein VFB79_21580 [Candidatus Angelobacter sp.]|nr:hypothetical protein [Candidatus Angelobacter sp.]